MHILERPGALAELDALYRQWRIGALTTREYEIAFAAVDAAHSHGLLCDNGDRRRAVLNIGGRLLCGVCGQKWQEARS